MSAKSRDEHNRWRNITVGFRVSPEENEQLNEVVALSGLPKQEYCYRRCMQRDIVVQPNPRVYKALKTTMEKILSELQRLSDAGGVTDEMWDTLTLLIATLKGMKGDDADGIKKGNDRSRCICWRRYGAVISKPYEP